MVLAQRFSSAALAVLFICAESSYAFAPGLKSSTTNANPSPQHELLAPGSSSLTSMQSTPLDDIADGEEWDPLVDGDISVLKHILEEGEGDYPSKGSTIELEYTGTLLGEKDWSTEDVVECWLSTLQGLDHLSPQFLENDIDGETLMDASVFTEEYCMENLGITNKIQAKKLIMASKRLIKQQEEYPPGTEFDSSISRGKNYSFVLGQGKVIKAMELTVSAMEVGERALVICRSDYGYGSEGLRTSKGDVMVPPFATLCFNLKLVSAS